MSEQSPPTVPPSPGADPQAAGLDDDEISLLDLALVLARHKKLILGLPAVAAMTSIVVSLLLPNIYTATTRILPPQQTQSTSAAMLAQIGNLAGLAGGSGAAKNPNDLYIGMIKSRTVADNIIKRFDLNRVYEQKYQSGVRAALEGATRAAAGKDGIISIEVDDRDPKRAADIANAYVDELFQLTKVLAVTEASQRRLFFERQVEQAKENLARAEGSTREALQKTGLVQVEAHGRALAESSARLRAQISIGEVQVGAMRAFASVQNPDLIRKQQELDAMKRELARLEGAREKDRGGPKSDNGTTSESLQQLREMKYREATYELLAKQFEIAKIDEAKDSAIIQVMDRAIEPDLKSKPRRGLIVILSTLAAGILAVLWAFVREAGNKARGDPQHVSRMREMRDLLGFRS